MVSRNSCSWPVLREKSSSNAAAAFDVCRGIVECDERSLITCIKFRVARVKKEQSDVFEVQAEVVEAR